MQKIKFISDMLFYIIGTAVIGIVAFIIVTNFIEDRNYMQGEVVIASATIEEEKEVQKEVEEVVVKSVVEEAEIHIEEEFSTYIYKRAPDALRRYYVEDTESMKKSDSTVEKKDSKKSEEKKDSKKSKEIKVKKNEDVKIEIIESKNQEGTAKKIQKTLELSGFDVVVSKLKYGKVSRTKIIERNKEVDGEKVINILNIGYILESTSKNSKYDITIVVGNDFNP